jgi:hypothetical protein
MRIINLAVFPSESLFNKGFDCKKENIDKIMEDNGKDIADSDDIMYVQAYETDKIAGAAPPKRNFLKL